MGETLLAALREERSKQHDWYDFWISFLHFYLCKLGVLPILYNRKSLQ